ncbi:MAG TPA: SDR family NAD(P)-dependent oxidoreductase [Bauldia sp.]|nr:SDR family NAD(P)-dependent oxidoreductase [Bauldia sp.]
MSNPRRVALVTGANQGIGLEVCRQLRAHGYDVILTSRDEKAGRAAAKDAGVEYLRLDVTSEADIKHVAEALHRDKRKLDVLVNNAGISMDGFNHHVVKTTVGINFHGALAVTEGLLPVIADGASIVFVSSGMGELHPYSPAIRSRFADTKLTRDKLLALVDEFIEGVRTNRHTHEGWPSSAYRVSKAAMVALAKVLARDLSARNIRVNAVCPGWVRTRMGGRSAPRSLEQGAKSVVWAATVAGPVTGGFYRDGKAANW